MSSITFRSDQDPSKLTLNELTFPSEGTAQKHPQYYSNNQHSATVKRKLLDEYPKEDQEYKQVAGETAVQYPKPPSSLTFNRELLHQMRTAINTHQISSQHLQTTPTLNYQSVEFGTIPYAPLKIQLPEKQGNARQGGLAPSPLVAGEPVRPQLAIQQIKPILPPQKINSLRKEMVDFYKENRNINFEYRQAKFMKLFGAKPQNSHLNI